MHLPDVCDASPCCRFLALSSNIIFNVARYLWAELGLYLSERLKWALLTTTNQTNQLTGDYSDEDRNANKTQLL